MKKNFLNYAKTKELIKKQAKKSLVEQGSDSIFWTEEGDT